VRDQQCIEIGRDYNITQCRRWLWSHHTPTHPTMQVCMYLPFIRTVCHGTQCQYTGTDSMPHNTFKFLKEYQGQQHVYTDLHHCTLQSASRQDPLRTQCGAGSTSNSHTHTNLQSVTTQRIHLNPSCQGHTQKHWVTDIKWQPSNGNWNTPCQNPCSRASIWHTTQDKRYEVYGTLSIYHTCLQIVNLGSIVTYRVSRGECARLRENVP